jgi:hypothetical protein
MGLGAAILTEPRSQGVKKLQNARMAFESTPESSDFQAEYEGSIPFTRSNVFRHYRPNF